MPRRSSVSSQPAEPAVGSTTTAPLGSTVPHRSDANVAFRTPTRSFTPVRKVSPAARAGVARLMTPTVSSRAHALRRVSEPLVALHALPTHDPPQPRTRPRRATVATTGTTLPCISCEGPGGQPVDVFASSSGTALPPLEHPPEAGGAVVETFCGMAMPKHALVVGTSSPAVASLHPDLLAPIGAKVVDDTHLSHSSATPPPASPSHHGVSPSHGIGRRCSGITMTVSPVLSSRATGAISRMSSGPLLTLEPHDNGNGHDASPGRTPPPDYIASSRRSSRRASLTSAISESRFMEREERREQELQEMEEDMHARSVSHEPRNVRARRIAVASVLALAAQHWLLRLPTMVQRTAKLEWAHRVLRDLFVPLYKCHARRRRVGAHLVLRRFLRICVARYRIRKRGRAAVILRDFFKAQTAMALFCFRSLRTRLLLIQAAGRRHEQRRQAQVDLQLRHMARRDVQRRFWSGELDGVVRLAGQGFAPMHPPELPLSIVRPRIREAVVAASREHHAEIAAWRRRQARYQQLATEQGLCLRPSSRPLAIPPKLSASAFRSNILMSGTTSPTVSPSSKAGGPPTAMAGGAASSLRRRSSVSGVTVGSLLGATLGRSQRGGTSASDDKDNLGGSRSRSSRSSSTAAPTAAEPSPMSLHDPSPQSEPLPIIADDSLELHPAEPCPVWRPLLSDRALGRALEQSCVCAAMLQDDARWVAHDPGKEDLLQRVPDLDDDPAHQRERDLEERMQSLRELTSSHPTAW